MQRQSVVMSAGTEFVLREMNNAGSQKQGGAKRTIE
jgi:hypothetical protein